MNRDELEGKAEALKGHIKQAAGDLTNDPDLHDEGVADEAAGKAQDAVGRRQAQGWRGNRRYRSRDQEMRRSNRLPGKKPGNLEVQLEGTVNLIVLLVILLLLFGGGGFYYGGPAVGGGLGGIILLVLVVLLLTGRLR